LRAEVSAGRFREDLYYRLNVFPVVVPPLSERVDDIPLLAAHFIECVAGRLGRDAPRLTRAASETLRRHPWPGNVRELRNVIERAVILSPGTRLQLDLPTAAPASLRRSGKVVYPLSDPIDGIEIMSDSELRNIERENLHAALQRTRWKIAGPGGAAELLGVRPTTLASRIRKLGIERPV
jgi:transcriptional regulator with GAF, ATPase, and Fis domain